VAVTNVTAGGGTECHSMLSEIAQRRRRHSDEYQEQIHAIRQGLGYALRERFFASERRMGELASPSIAGLKILLVEDESLVAMLVEDALDALQCQVIGSASRLRNACELAGRDGFDLAILDINIGGEPVYPVAEVLAHRKIPFVFLTGYGVTGVAEPFRDRPILQKPFRLEELRKLLVQALRLRDNARSEESRRH
jgi:CheY-like chemotaxis protein